VSTPTATIRSGLLVVAVATLTVLAGCTSAAEPTPSDAPTSSSQSAAPQTAAPVALVPGGTADQNLPFFEQVVRSTVAGDPQTPGRSVVDALVAAGFSQDAMQLTADETSVGLEADSVQVSVRMTDACLVGQYGPKVDGVRVAVVAPIATGACLIGRTTPLQG
jgi:hypothetical protein